MIAVTAAHAQYAVTATWDPNTDSSTAGYRLYYGTASGSYQWSVDVGSQTSAPLSLSAGRYYFAVRAYNSNYDYGPSSNEASFDVGASTSAAPTAAIQASLQASNTALVSWQTANATSASINGIAVPLTGSTTVSVTTTTTFTITASNAAGATATASATVTVGTGGSTGTAPLAPESLTAAVSGSRATLAWRPPSSGSAPTEYLLSVGTRSGASNISRDYPVGNVLTVSGDLPRGRYYARVRSRNASGTSPTSNEVSFRIGTRLASPTGFTVTWQGTQATLSWVASAADSADRVPTGYVLEAGTAPGLADVATLPIGRATRFTTSVPSGIYYVRVRAVNDSGDSDPTPDLVVAPPGTAAAPTGLAASGVGSTVSLSWTPPPGEAPLGYVIEAGSEPGLANLASIRVGTPRFTTTAPPGTYYVRVRAVNALGVGVPSNEIIVRR